MFKTNNLDVNQLTQPSLNIIRKALLTGDVAQPQTLVLLHIFNRKKYPSSGRVVPLTRKHLHSLPSQLLPTITTLIQIAPKPTIPPYIAATPTTQKL